jgi:hypothetical protein
MNTILKGSVDSITYYTSDYSVPGFCRSSLFQKRRRFGNWIFPPLQVKGRAGPYSVRLPHNSWSPSLHKLCQLAITTLAPRGALRLSQSMQLHGAPKTMFVLSILIIFIHSLCSIRTVDLGLHADIIHKLIFALGPERC